MNEAAIREFLQAEQLPASYRTIIAHHILPLAKVVRRRQQTQARPLLVGINGAQGTGKTTLAKVLHRVLENEHGLRVVTLSLDDFYLRRSERQQLAEAVHPLLITRGVPGTHDTGLLAQTLHALRTEAEQAVGIPRFSKTSDDQLPAAQWRHINTPLDVILFEGWCVAVAAEPEDALLQPANTLEATEDNDRRWRQYVNQRLAQDYAPLFANIDYLVMLRAPSFYAVLEWRSLQEQRLREALGETGAAASRLLDRAQIARFIQHFERLTRHALKTLPAQADCLLQLNVDHEIESCSARVDA